MPDLRVRALQLLTRRDYSRAELQKAGRACRICRRTRRVLDTLQGERLLSDHRYATQRVTARAGRYGDARLKQELRLKGVSDDDIAAALPEAATKPSAALRSGSASSASRTNAGRACQTDAFPAISRFFQRSHPPCLRGIEQ
jgi:SOS response regulatory protein OraA/RecX